MDEQTCAMVFNLIFRTTSSSSGGSSDEAFEVGLQEEEEEDSDDNTETGASSVEAAGHRLSHNNRASSSSILGGGSSSSSSSRKKSNRSSGLRSGVRLDRAYGRTTVEPSPTAAASSECDDDDTMMSKTKQEKIRAKHLVKILVDDENFIEVSPEQLKRIHSMHKKIDDEASFSFNYNTLLCVASVLGGLGLVSNSTTTIIASMLVSPIMMPVIALAYGTTINDWKLVRKAIKVESLSLLFCIFMGILIGVITGPLLSENWPTHEMKMRGTTENFFVAIPTAFFSGLGVAVSLLDEQTASLVGVAISASLLPPAVNAGVLWIAYLFEENNVINISCTETANASTAMPEEGGRLLGSATGFFDILFDTQDNHLESNCDDEVGNSGYYRAGTISLLLTLVNILLIWLSGMLMFRMKEVLPIKKKVFWEDLGVARKIYQNRALLSRNQYCQSSDLVEAANNSV